MNLKEHNDIVQKLLEQIELKDNSINKLNKQLSAVAKTSQLAEKKTLKANSPTEVQKQMQKRIAQLNKEHNAKLAQLNQEIKSLSQENNELKQRLALKGNLDQKQKDHIAEVIKKNIDRKPGSQHDIRITSLVTHYEAELNKKNNFIQTLKRQIKSLSLKQTGASNQNTKKNQAQSNKQIDNDEQIQQRSQQGSRKFVSLLQHNSVVQKLQRKVRGYIQNQQKKNKQLSELKARYNELTKEYYRVLNEYGIDSTTITKGKSLKSIKLQDVQQAKQVKSREFLSKNSMQSRVSFDLSEDESDQEKVLGQMSDGEVSISINFQQKFKKFNNRPRISPDELQQQSNVAEDSSQTLRKAFTKKPHPRNQLLSQIIQLLNIQSQDQILPVLSSMVTQQSFAQLNESILKSIHELLYKFGMGKVSKSQMLQTIHIFQLKCNTWLESTEILNQICIELGAKKNKLTDKITHYKQLQTQLMQKMKTVSFLTQLNKSHKLLEFIDFFQLDKTDLKLPQQLRNIYQQLKYVDRFIKQANSTLNVHQKKGLEETLQLILRKLQTYHEWEVQLEQQNQRKALKKTQKQAQF